MLPKECVEFATANTIAYVATTEGNQPHVRAIMLMPTDETGFYIPTLSPKNFARQLEANPNIEMCFYNNPSDIAEAKMLRVVGTVQPITDAGFLANLVEQRQFIKDLAGDRWKDEYQICWKLSKGKFVFWTLGDVLKEPDMIWTDF